MNQQEVYAAFTLAGFKDCGYEKIRNAYWPSHEDYDRVRDQNPWWIVTTELGDIRLGWRKRVIEVDWVNTNRRGIVTEDDVTKGTSLVHAYSLSKLVQYLKAIRSLPIVDIPLPEFKSVKFTKGADVRMILKDMVDDDTPEHGMMMALVEDAIGKDMEVSMSYTTPVEMEKGHSTRVVIHFGHVRVEFNPPPKAPSEA